MLSFVRNAWAQRALLASLIKRDFVGSYTGSILGTVWAFIDPLMYIALTLLFFQFAIRGVETSGVPYVAWVLPQIVFWTFISNVVNSAVNSIREYNFLMRHRDFDLRLIALIKMGSALIVHLFMVSIVLFVLFVMLGVQISIRTPTAVYYLLSMCILLIILSWIISSLGVFWKDIRNIVSVILQIQFWISPIFWDANRFPGPIAFVMKLNPFYYPMNGYRQAILSIQPGPEFWPMTIYFWVVVICLAFLGSHLFRRLSRSFGDVI